MRAAPDKPSMMRLGMVDLKVGYVLSAVLAVIFVSLGRQPSRTRAA